MVCEEVSLTRAKPLCSPLGRGSYNSRDYANKWQPFGAPGTAYVEAGIHGCGYYPQHPGFCKTHRALIVIISEFPAPGRSLQIFDF